ncbi:zinc dependent phospholipase C family protein [Thermoflavimicrobium dichotomicum]|uniref:Zinc dependent phospholipase C n=1 Tax=Thermoflavimicrobium dichotomicum TaxID=46223 RepID=A0A1I3MEG8_9BACL|nr:zinc dependent phospholipase C family protein [Thermoflavimicrobium dichotomicum]SFI95429.1 Zinc dependent phospholipase C [Thermoflavimicrobium dichotomicum]
MPYAWTHILFGHELIQQAKLSPPQNRSFFQLGCQGPDFFFFHRFWQFTKKKTGERLGNLFHTKNCGPVLVEFIEAAKTYADLRDYVLGFITHYILDYSTHPYIHYRAGYKRFKHQELEVIIDTLIALELRNLKTWSTPLVPEIDIGHLPSHLVDIFWQITHQYYSDGNQEWKRNHYDEAYQHMKKAFQLFFDPQGLKSFFTFGLIAPFRHKKNIPNRDYLNLKRENWTHPAIKEETYTDSFWDLWEAALQDGKRILPRVVRYWETGEETRESLLQLVGNRSYDHGKDCSLNLDNVLSDPIV